MAKVAEVVLTSRIREALDLVINSDKIADRDKIEFRNVLTDRRNETTALTFKIVRNLANILSASGQKVYLHDLLRGSDLHLASLEAPKKNEELEARLTKLRADAANKEYDQMVGNLAKKTDPLDFSIGQDVKALNRQMTAVFNFIITVVAAFVFGYKGSDLLLGVSDVPERLVYGLFLGTVVFFADLYFLVKHTK